MTQEIIQQMGYHGMEISLTLHSSFKDGSEYASANASTHPQGPDDKYGSSSGFVTALS